MGKKGPKVSKQGKKGGKKALDESQVYVGKDTFGFRNGDTYGGSFFASVDGTIYRQGIGQQAAVDGHVYRGLWERDVLQGEVKSQYPDSSRYEGPVVAQEYQGPGTYIFPDGSRMNCTFEKNIPTAQVTLSDPLGRTMWYGQTHYGGVALLQTNRFLPRHLPPPIESLLPNEGVAPTDGTAATSEGVTPTEGISPTSQGVTPTEGTSPTSKLP